MAYKDLVKGMFLKEETNEQLVIVKKKTNCGKNINWADFTVLKTGDVNTPQTLIDNEIIPCIDNLGTLLDISCGDGSIVIAYANLLLKNNISKEEVSSLLYIADSKEINILLTLKRLKDIGINLDKQRQTLLYTKIDEAEGT